MVMRAAKRIKRELDQVIRSEEVAQCGIKVELLNDCLNELKGEIAGPPGTPYEGGKFILKIKLPNNYPFDPPFVRFKTKIWHPNISSATGAVCLDLLKEAWSAAITLRSLLLSIQQLLSSAEPDDPQDAIVGKQYKMHPEIFNLTARHWTNVYAGGPSHNQDYVDKINQLVEMGLNERKAREVLSSYNWDVLYATNILLNN